MNGAAAPALVEELSVMKKTADRYCSAEFLVEGLAAVYHFRIWDMAAPSLSVLVNEKSGILTRLKVGDTLNVKYYSNDWVYPPDFKWTAIRHITRNDQGRLKGNFLVGLEILES
jgi:hypothetical protein